MVRVAACQIKVSEDTDKNLKKILKYLECAGKNKIDIICFPEKSLQWQNIPYRDLSSHLEKIGTICKKYAIYCLVGGIVYDNKKKINNLYLINRQGKIQAIHSKVNLFYMEKQLGFYKAGKQMTVVKTDFGKIGLSICWDNANPDLIKELSKKGAEIIFAAMHLNDHKKMGYSLPDWPQIRSFENMSYYVWVDQFRTNKSSSKSYIIHPQKVIKSIENKEGIIYSDINLKEIKDLRKKFGLP
jgi:predicted amidohydrolase